MIGGVSRCWRATASTARGCDLPAAIGLRHQSRVGVAVVIGDLFSNPLRQGWCLGKSGRANLGKHETLIRSFEYVDIPCPKFGPYLEASLVDAGVAAEVIQELARVGRGEVVGESQDGSALTSAFDSQCAATTFESNPDRAVGLQ